MGGDDHNRRDRSRDRRDRSRDRRDRRSRSRDRRDRSRDRRDRGDREDDRKKERVEEKPTSRASEPAKPVELKPGMAVMVQGLQKNPEKNGAIGTLLEYNEEKSRWVVEFPSSATNNFKAENLEPMAEGDKETAEDDDEDPPTPKVYITGLDSSVVEQDLVQLFSGLGALAKEPVRNSKGSAKGFRDEWPFAVKIYKPGKKDGDACVEYMDKMAAKAAIKTFNGYKLKGSKITVQYAGQGKKYEPRELTLPWAERQENDGRRDD